MRDVTNRNETQHQKKILKLHTTNSKDNLGSGRHIFVQVGEGFFALHAHSCSSVSFHLRAKSGICFDFRVSGVAMSLDYNNAWRCGKY